jgi:hypothetical protein
MTMRRKLAGVLARALLRVAYHLLNYSDASAEAYRRHIRTTIQLADFPPSVAAEFIARGVPPHAVARQMADALRTLQ